MPKAKRLREAGQKWFLSEIRAQFKLCNFVVYQESLRDSQYFCFRKATAAKRNTWREKGKKSWPNNKTATSKTR
jgi:hypothetical protein